MPNPYRETNAITELSAHEEAAMKPALILPSGDDAGRGLPIIVPSGDDSLDISWGRVALLALVIVGCYKFYVFSKEHETTKATLAATWAYQSNTCVRADGSRENLLPPDEKTQMRRLPDAVETRDGRLVYAYAKGPWDCALEWRKR